MAVPLLVWTITRVWSWYWKTEGCRGRDEEEGVAALLVTGDGDENTWRRAQWRVQGGGCGCVVVGVDVATASGSLAPERFVFLDSGNPVFGLGMAHQPSWRCATA